MWIHRPTTSSLRFHRRCRQPRRLNDTDNGQHWQTNTDTEKYSSGPSNFALNFLFLVYPFSFCLSLKNKQNSNNTKKKSKKQKSIAVVNLAVFFLYFAFALTVPAEVQHIRKKWKKDDSWKNYAWKFKSFFCFLSDQRWPIEVMFKRTFFSLPSPSPYSTPPPLPSSSNKGWMANGTVTKSER